MHSLVKYWALILVLCTISVYAKPYCGGWCSNYGCCGDHSHYSLPLFCPILNCSNPPTNSLKECNSDEDCLRKEKCCKNPCDGGRSVCLTGTHTWDYMPGCSQINNCDEWRTNNPSPTHCTMLDDCKRSEVCCRVPCTDQKVCQKIPYIVY